MGKKHTETATKTKSKPITKRTVLKPIEIDSPYPSKENPHPPMKLGGGRDLGYIADTLFDDDLYN